MPRRLDTRGPYEEGTYSMFSFDRSAWWPIGSNRPVPERLSLAVWTPASRVAARAFAITDARDRTDSILWRREGPFEIGEGLHSVNIAENPTWIVVGDYEDRGMTIAYMVWKQRVARQSTLGERFEARPLLRDRPGHDRRSQHAGVRHGVLRPRVDDDGGTLPRRKADSLGRVRRPSGSPPGGSAPLMCGDGDKSDKISEASASNERSRRDLSRRRDRDHWPARCRALTWPRCTRALY
jgi:hypothetical protein